MTYLIQCSLTQKRGRKLRLEANPAINIGGSPENVSRPSKRRRDDHHRTRVYGFGCRPAASIAVTAVSATSRGNESKSHSIRQHSMVATPVRIPLCPSLLSAWQARKPRTRRRYESAESGRSFSVVRLLHQSIAPFTIGQFQRAAPRSRGHIQKTAL